MRARPWHQTPWDWRAGIQFSCGGTGTGLLLFTAVASFQDVNWLTYTGWLSLVIIGIGLLSVWVKLGQRWRAMYVVLNPRTSWMSREAFLSLPLLGFGFFGLVLQSPSLTLVGALFGVGFLFAQGQMLKTSRGIPAWREPLLLPLILVTGWVEGAGFLLLATAVFGEVGVWLPATLFVLLLLRLWLWTSYRRTLAQPGAAPLATVIALDKIQNTEIWLGHILPLVILLIVPLVPAPTTVTAVAAIAAGLLAMFPGWLMKYTIIAKAAFNQGFALTRTPARTPGYSGSGTKPGW